MNRRERNELLKQCRLFTGYDIWWDGDMYVVEDTKYRCQSIHELCWYCEVYEEEMA